MTGETRKPGLRRSRGSPGRFALPIILFSEKVRRTVPVSRYQGRCFENDAAVNSKGVRRVDPVSKLEKITISYVK